MHNLVRTDNQDSPVIQFADAQNIINIYDSARVKKLAEDMIEVVNVLWPKAKNTDINTLNEKTFWRLLEMSKQYDVLSVNGRADVCAILCDELNQIYNNRCKLRLKQASKKQLEKYAGLFLQYVSVMSYIVYGDIKSQIQLVTS